MLKFIDENDIKLAIESDIRNRKVNTTPRNGNSISLRPILYNCIREIYYEIFDYEREVSDDISAELGFYWTGLIGSALHEKLQSLTKLDEQYYTEKLLTFQSFSPLQIRTKCDGIDLRDPDNIILYEFKTKDKMPDKPYHEELLQNLLSVFFFRRECQLNIKGSSMVYINRTNPDDIRFFNYDFFDVTSPLYIDVGKELSETFEKVQEILECMKNKRAPSIKSKFIKQFAYGRKRCTTCVYRNHCQKDNF